MIRLLLIALGLALVLIGVEALGIPGHLGIRTNAFRALAATGAFREQAVILIVPGVVLIAAAFLFPRVRDGLEEPPRRPRKPDGS